MKLFQATIAVALLASSPAASGKPRIDRASKLPPPIAGTLRSKIFPPPGFAFGGRVKESMARKAKSNPERRIQEISDACWHESGELDAGQFEDELFAAWDDCDIDDETGSTTCSGDYAELEAACAAGGGKDVSLDFSFECTDDMGTFLVEYTSFPECFALSCDEEDLTGMAEDSALTEIDTFYSDLSCGNIMVSNGETMDEAEPLDCGADTMAIAQEIPGEAYATAWTSCEEAEVPNSSITTSTCPADDVDSRYQAACKNVGGRITFHDIAITCDLDPGSQSVVNYNFPFCASDLCAPESVEDKAIATGIIIQSYETAGVSCIEANLASLEEEMTAEPIEAETEMPADGGEDADAEDSGSVTEKDIEDNEMATMDKEKDPTEPEPETTIEENGPAESEIEETAEAMDQIEMPAEEDEMMEADTVPYDACYDETDAMNSNAEMLQELTSAYQLCKPDFGEDFVTVNCGSTPEYKGLCNDFGGRVMLFDFEFMCSNPPAGFTDTIPVSYINFPLCTLCGPEADTSFKTALEGMLLKDFLRPQGFVCDIADSDNVGAMASDTSTSSATSISYTVIFPFVVLTIGFNILSF